MPGDLVADYRARGLPHRRRGARAARDATCSSSGRRWRSIDDTHEVTWAELADAAAAGRRACCTRTGSVPVTPSCGSCPIGGRRSRSRTACGRRARSRCRWCRSTASTSWPTIMRWSSRVCVIGPPEFRGHDHVDMLDAAAAGRRPRPEAPGGRAGRGDGLGSWDDAQRATPHVETDRSTRRADDRRLHLGHDVGSQGRGREHPWVPRGADAPPPRDAVHVPRPRLHARAGVAHHRSARWRSRCRSCPGCSVVLRERWDAPQCRRRHAALRRDVHGRRDGVHPGAGRRGGGGRARLAPARVWLQPRRQRDPARRGGAGRGPGHEAPACVRDDRVPDGVGVARRRRPRRALRHRRAHPARASTCAWSTPTGAT